MSTHQDKEKNHAINKEIFKKVGIEFGILLLIFSTFDLLIDGFSGLMDLVIETIHLAVEAVEYSIEVILENSINTGHQASEMIIVNGAIVIGLYLIYRFMRTLPKRYRRIKRNTKAYFLKRKRRKAHYWHSITLGHKIKWVCAYGFCTSCLLFFIIL